MVVAVRAQILQDEGAARRDEARKTEEELLRSSPLDPLVKHTERYFKNYRKSTCLIGKSTINGPCSIAIIIVNYQRVNILAFTAKSSKHMYERTDA